MVIWLDDISTSIILEKNELMYLVGCLANENRNSNAAILSEYTGISEPDSRKAIASLMQKNILCLAGNRLVTIKLFDFYVRKLLSADSVETVNGEGKKLIFSNPGFCLLIREHMLSENHISIQAFRSKQDIHSMLKETRENL